MDSDWRMVSADGYRVESYPTMPVLEAFGHDHLCDAHLTCYTIKTANGLITDPMPRLTKPLVAGLDRMRAEEQESIKAGRLAPERAVFAHILAVVGTMLALDFDLPDHVKWTEGNRQQVEQMLSAASGRWPLLAAPTVFYTTNGGFRMVWVLDDAVDVHGPGGLEDLLFGLVAQAHIAGLTVDTACKDWTRLFRLPRVVRADKPPVEAQTWIQPYYAQSWGRYDFTAREATPPNGRVILHSSASFTPLSRMTLDEFRANAQSQLLGDKWKLRIGRSPRDLRDTFRSIEMGEMPDDGTIANLLTGGTSQSAAHKQVVMRLRALAYPRDVTKTVPEALHAYKVLVENDDIRIDKQLHQGISKLARSLCYCFRERLGERPMDITAQFIHSLVVQPARRANQVRATEGDGKTRSEQEIDAEVWRLVKWFYQHFRGVSIITAEEAEDEAKERSDLQLRLIAQVGAYQEAIVRSIVAWSGPEDAVVRDYATQNWNTMLLLKHSDGRSVLSFSPTGQIFYSTPADQFGDVLSLGRDCGHNLIPWTYETLEGKEQTAKMEDIYRIYSKVTEGLVLSRLVPNSRLRLERTKDGMSHTFVRAIPGIRTDIVPKYDPQVDEWLHLLGGRDADELLDWLAVFPLIDKPSSALYLQGHGGIGKGMLGLALMNLTTSRIAAPFDQVVQDFQDTMVKTPFVWADEKVTTKRMSKTLMDSFKKLISGEFNTLNIKGKSHVTVEGQWRVLITANHANALPWDEEVSGADLDAVRQRLTYVRAPAATVLKFLDAQGQREGTAGWPEYTVPAHIMHLATTRQVAKGGRFLVEAKLKQYHEDLQSRTSGSDEVLRLLGRMLQEPSRHASSIIFKDDQVFVNVTAAYAVMSNIVAQERRQNFPKSERVMAKAIKNVSLDEESLPHRVTAGRTKITKVVRLWRINMRFLIEWLDRNEQDADLRQSIGLTIWQRDAPERIQTLYEQIEAGPNPPPPSQKAPKPPAPPPPISNVLSFPNIGKQSLKNKE